MNDEKQNLVTYHRDGFIGSITLNRPDKRNALNPAVWRALGQAVQEAAADGEARVILLQGKGKSFCAGLDLSPDNELFSLVGDKASASQKTAFFREVRLAQKVYTDLERLNRPVIAVVQKHCLGAGLEMALCADIMLCTADAVFALPEAKLGFITDVGGLQRLAKFVGKPFVREIAFRGHRFDAQWAKEINLVNRLYEDEAALQKGALEIAQEIADNPPLAVQGAKEVLLYDEDASLAESLEYNAARSSMIVPSEDLGEAINSYLEKRKGDFKGK
ncbi:MAG: enoyl-CoA hydratase/isomerase family protein [Deltaproteobacteria bacterium]|nr:enoyl-CoA hydratase/isomerase family protein [Deltaproteobacteria bacterium]MBW1818966.1 enoyl-CoA hydratase/isomerase family protein [Deltaproteobacteria bacterium]